MIKKILCIAAMSAAGLFAQQNAQQTKQPKISKAQADAIMKVQTAAQAKDWDGVMQAATDVVENYADSPYKHRVLLIAMQAAQNKGDYEQIVIWGDRVIQDDPNDVLARVTVANEIAQHTRSTDLTRDQNLTKAEDYANKALSLLQNMNTQPENLPTDPSQWTAMKASLTGQAHYALASCAELKKDFAGAQKEFQQAIAADPNNATYQARLASCDINLKQYDDAIAAAQKALDNPNAPPQVKQFAQNQKDRATSLKGAAAK